MKRITSLLTVLVVWIGMANAANYTWPESGDARVTLTDGDAKTQLLQVAAEGDLAAFFDATSANSPALGELGADPNRWVLKISGTLGASDLAVLDRTQYSQINVFKLVDFSDATLSNCNLVENYPKQALDQWGYPGSGHDQAVIWPANNVPSKAQIKTWQGYMGQYNSWPTLAYWADDSKTELHTYTYYNSGATNTQMHDNLYALAYLAPLGNENLTIAFDYNYTGQTDSPVPCDPTFLTAMSEIPAACFDFRGINISELGVNFSMLGADTHYIIIPTADSNTAGTKYPDIDNPGNVTDGTKYNFGDNIYAVSVFLPAGNSAWMRANYDGITYKTEALMQPTRITYVTENGHGNLDDIESVLLKNPMESTRFNIIGAPTCDDLKVLGKVQINLVDMMHAKNTEWMCYESEYVEYLALPDGKKELIINNVNVTADGYSNPFTKLTNLKSVASYDPTLNLYTAYAAKNVQTRTQKVIKKDNAGNPVLAAVEYGDPMGWGYNYFYDTRANNNNYIKSDIVVEADPNNSGTMSPVTSYVKDGAWVQNESLYYYYETEDVEFQGQVPSIGILTRVIQPTTATEPARFARNSTFANGLTHMQMLGYFTPEDLSVDGDYYANAGLNNAIVEWIDLSKAYFPNHPDDMAFAYNAAVPGSINNHYGWDNQFFYHIDLPTHKDMNELPPAFLDNMSVLGGGPTHNSMDDGATAEWHSLYTFDYPEPGTIYEGVCIPSNVEYIRTYAFNGCNRLNHIYTTAASNDADLGVDAGAYDNGQNTFTFSTNLKEIETGAFWCGGDNGSGHDGVWSVYPLSKQAPKCQTRSFSPKVLVNKNGFNPSHPICIDSYQDGQQGMAILRYPNGLPDDLEKLYTDITRIFSLADETGATDGDGNLIYWPTQTEFDRAYQQGQLGYIWEDWDMTMMWGQYQKMVHGFGTDDVSDFAATTQSEFVVSGDGVHYSYQDFLDDMTALRAYFKDYIGWHEFVLAWPGRTYNQDTQKDAEYVELDWYTLCVPVDMTVADVAKYMGVVKASEDPTVVNKYVYKTQKINRNNSEETAFGDATTKTLVTWDYVLPDIRQLKSIERNLVNGNINIHLSLDLAGQYPFEQKIMVPSTIKKDASVEGNEESRFTFAYNDYVDAIMADTTVIIKGGFPYLVKPIVPVSMKNNYPGPGKFIMARLDVNDEKYDYKQGKNYFGYYKEFEGNKVRLPYDEYLLQATNPANGGAKEFVQNDESNGEYLYNFIGRYVEDVIPQYSYYMGVSKSGVHKFYRATTTSKKWSAFSAIIAPLGKATYSYGEVGEKTSESDGKQTSYDTKYEGTTDDTVSQEGYGKFTFIFDDTMDEMVGETDGIKTINDQTTVTNAQKVYSVNGQYVGKSLQGLGKGLYIMNGKKYVIK